MKKVVKLNSRSEHKTLTNAGIPIKEIVFRLNFSNQTTYRIQKFIKDYAAANIE